jgi:hypothetical protein
MQPAFLLQKAAELAYVAVAFLPDIEHDKPVKPVFSRYGSHLIIT